MASASPSPAPAAAHGNIISTLFGWIPVLIANVINVINLGVHNLAISLILLAALIRLVFWPLNTAQFKSMLGMQKIAPKMKQLQARYKSDPTKLQQETMALYKSEGVNPLAGCLPMLLQLPILFSVYYAVVTHRDLYAQTAFLWIGSGLSTNAPVLFGTKLFAASLAAPDLLLIVIYMVSQYIAMRFTTMPPTDDSQVQTMKMMQVMSPLMIGFFGLKAGWPSGMVLYWLSYNIFTMGQQLYLIKRYHEPLSFIDSDHVVTDTPVPVSGNDGKKKLPQQSGAAKTYKVKKKTKGANS